MITATFNTGIAIYNNTPLPVEFIEKFIPMICSANSVKKAEYLQDCQGFKQFIVEVIPPFKPTNEHSLYKHIVWVEFISPDLATLAKLGAP